MSKLELLEKRLRRTACQDALIGLGLLALAVVTFAAAVAAARISQRIGVGLFGLGFLWCAWRVARGVRRSWPARRSRVYRELSSGGQGIGWVHLTQGAFTAIKLYFLDGELDTIYANTRDGERLLQSVVARMPNVIVGYGPEQEQAYGRLVEEHRAARTGGDASVHDGGGRPTEPPPPRLAPHVTGGLRLTALGALLLAIAIGWPLLSAWLHLSSISLLPELSALGGIFTLVGIAQLVTRVARPIAGFNSYGGWRKGVVVLAGFLGAAAGIATQLSVDAAVLRSGFVIKRGEGSSQWIQERSRPPAPAVIDELPATREAAEKINKILQDLTSGRPDAQ